jgi:predicted Zn-dependent protease
MFPKNNKILVRGKEEVSEEKSQLVNVLEDIGERVDRELNPIELSSWQPEKIDDSFGDYYHEVRDHEWLESELSHEKAGVNGNELAITLQMQYLHEELEQVPVMHVTDQPIFVDEPDTGEVKHVYGVTKPGDYNTAAVLSTFAFQEMNPKNQREMFETLSYHEAGHLLSPFGYEREYTEENQFGGGHCPNKDVMTGEGILQNTEYRVENNVYCGECLEEIKAGIEQL